MRGIGSLKQLALIHPIRGCSKPAYVLLNWTNRFMQKNGNGAVSCNNEVACLVVADRGSDEGRRIVRISRNKDLKSQGPLWCEVVPRAVAEMMEARGRYVCAFAISSKGTTLGAIEIVVTDNLLDLQSATLPRVIRSIPRHMALDVQLSLPPTEAKSMFDVIALSLEEGLSVY